MVIAPDIAPANLLAKLDQLGLARSLVQDEENVRLVEGVHGLHGDIAGVSSPDANNKYLLHHRVLRATAHPRRFEVTVPSPAQLQKRAVLFCAARAKRDAGSSYLPEFDTIAVDGE